MPLINYLSRINFDWGAVASLSAEIRRLAITRPLLISDQGIAAAGHLDRVLDAALPFRPEIFIGPNDTAREDCLLRCLDIWRGKGCDGLIALGGGSAIDLSKAVALVSSHGGKFEDYVVGAAGAAAVGNVSPQIAIPTAAGTGAELGRACVMQLASGGKSVVVSLNMVAETVLCDPGLTLTLPAQLTAATGADALSHGIEAAVSLTENPPAKAIAMDCVARAAAWLRAAVEDGSDRTARWEMMMAALEGGMCLQKGLGAAHAAVNPLETTGAHHGALIGVMLPHAVRFNGAAAREDYQDIAALPAVACEPGRLADWLTDLFSAVGLAARLSHLGIESGGFPAMAEQAAGNHLNLTNPRRAAAADYLQMLQAAF